MAYLYKFYYDVTEQLDGSRVTADMIHSMRTELRMYLKTKGIQKFTIIHECYGYFLDNGKWVEVSTEILEIGSENLLEISTTNNIKDIICRTLNQKEVYAIHLEGGLI